MLNNLPNNFYLIKHYVKGERGKFVLYKNRFLVSGAYVDINQNREIIVELIDLHSHIYIKFYLKHLNIKEFKYVNKLLFKNIEIFTQGGENEIYIRGISRSRSLYLKKGESISVNNHPMHLPKVKGDKIVII